MGGFVGVFRFPFLMQGHQLRGVELSAVAVIVLGLLITWMMLPETMYKSLDHGRERA